jgi:hypothetical protein
MAERRYTDDEVKAILAKATEGPMSAVRTDTAADGMTLAELQGIAREVGIPVDAVALAARSLDERPAAVARTFLALPLGVERGVELQRRLTDSEWEQLVVELRRAFNATGVVRTDGAFRQWRNGNLQALLEPTPTGQRLRLSTRNGLARTWMRGGLAAMGVTAALAISMAVAGRLGNAMPGVLMLGLIGAGMFSLGALRLPAWARRRARQFETITNGLALRDGSDDPSSPSR